MSAQLTKNEDRVKDILMSYPKSSPNYVVYMYWLRHIKNVSEFSVDFIGNKIPIEGITRAYRKVREAHPELCQPRKKKKQAEYHEHYSKQEGLF